MDFFWLIPCSCLKDVKCSGNWMWAAKLPGEGACLWDACKAMCEVMGQLGVAIDGGKDSLSMAARVGTETVKAPGTVSLRVYATCCVLSWRVCSSCELCCCIRGSGYLYLRRLSRHHSHCHTRSGGSRWPRYHTHTNALLKYLY